MHTFEYVEMHAEARGIVGMAQSFWYHLVVAQLIGDGMQRSGGEISGQRWIYVVRHPKRTES